MAIVLVVAVTLLSPVIRLGFYGDDYDLWAAGKLLIKDSSLIFKGPENFYRPANTWLFAVHQLLVGTEPWFYHTTTLLMHLGCGLLLWSLLRSMMASVFSPSVITLLWICSPFTFEPVCFVNVSYNDLTVVLVWLALANLWARPDRPWSHSRVMAAIVLVVLSAFCKESWIIVVGFVFAYELFLSHNRFSLAVTRALMAGIPVLIYVVVYLSFFSNRLGSGYYSGGIESASKVLHTWAAFSFFTTLQPQGYRIGPSELAALGVMLVCAGLGWRRKNHLIGLGFAFYLLPFIPIIPIPWMPTRYTAAPLLGFLMVFAGATQALWGMLGRKPRTIFAAAVISLAALVFVAEIMWLQGEIDDAQRLSAANAELLAEAEAFATAIPHDRIIVCARLEMSNRNEQLLDEGLSGLPKACFIRGGSPYGLIRWSALFSWVLDEFDGRLYVEVDPSVAGNEPFAVVGHREGAFVFLSPQASTVAGELEYWRKRNIPMSVIRPWVEEE